MPAMCKRRGIMRWRGKVTQDGRIVATKWFGEAKRTGDAEYKRALKWEEEKRKELQEKAKSETTTDTEYSTDPTVRTWANTYLDDVKRRYTEKTYNEKRFAFKRLQDFIDADEPAANLTRTKALTFLQTQFDTRSGNAANKDRKNLATAWSWGATYIDNFPQSANPFLSAKRFPEGRADRYVPPEEDFWKVWHQTAEGSQDRIMLTAFLHLAARRGEIFNMRWADIDWANRQVRLYTRKTRDGSWEYAHVPMTDELTSALLYWWEHRPHKQSEHVFTVTGEHRFENQYIGQPFRERRHFMRKLCERANIKRFGFHAIRHLSAVILYHAGYNLAVIQSILRHKNPSTTERYLKRLGLDPQRLHAAMDVFENREEKNGKVLDAQEALQKTQKKVRP